MFSMWMAVKPTEPVRGAEVAPHPSCRRHPFAAFACPDAAHRPVRMSAWRHERALLSPGAIRHQHVWIVSNLRRTATVTCHKIEHLSCPGCNHGNTIFVTIVA